MRICVFGAGAVGGHFAVKLAASGHEVSVVARGAHLDAIRRNGLVLKSGEQQIKAPVRASDKPAELGVQDFVISTLKANGLPALAAGIGPLLGPQSAVVFAQNGIPWWYGHGLPPSRRRPPDLSRLDPGGALARAVGAERALGGVIFSANTVIEPGVIENTTPQMNSLTVGEPDDTLSPRVSALQAALQGAGIGSKPAGDIRHAIWSKLLRNLSFSTLCLLTGRAIEVLHEDRALAEISSRLMDDGLAIAAAHGIVIDMPGAERSPPGGASIRHKPSILQDYELGRPMELEAMVMAPLAFGRVAGIATPTLDVVAALAARRAVDKGLYAP
jgi:2-dehydropantoate 2-reductase